MSIILGIDTSCDDTAAAVVENGTKVISNIVSTQTEIHTKYGGIVPELASRKHIEMIWPVVDEALKIIFPELLYVMVPALSALSSLVVPLQRPSAIQRASPFYQ